MKYILLLCVVGLSSCALRLSMTYETQEAIYGRKSTSTETTAADVPPDPNVTTTTTTMITTIINEENLPLYEAPKLKRKAVPFKKPTVKKVNPCPTGYECRRTDS